MDGILVIDKPVGITSHDVVAKARKILGTKKIGHTGTLDPLATGVLVLCVDKATKLVESLTCDDKIYEVEMKFGIKTDTADITGNIIEEKDFKINAENLEIAIQSLVGMQKQLPPMYSAIKVNGKKLYEYARDGIEVERTARDIEIFEISKVLFDGEILKYTIHCSKGTYVRTVCEEIAEKLGTVGTMTNLRRIKSGKFSIDTACKLEEISKDKIITIDKLFDKEITLNDRELFKLLNGMELVYDMNDDMYKVYTLENESKKFIGIAKMKDKHLKREIIL